MDKETVMTISITETEKEALMALAKRLGYTIGRGPMSSCGSVRQLNAAIAQGHLRVVPNDNTSGPSNPL